MDDLFQILCPGSFSVPDVPFPNSCSSGLLHFQGTAPEHESSEVQGVVCKGAKDLLDVLLEIRLII